MFRPVVIALTVPIVIYAQSERIEIPSTIEMKPLAEVNQTKALPEESGKRSPRRQKIVYPELENISASAGVIPMQPLPSFVIRLKNEGETRVNLQFHHASFKVSFIGYDGNRILKSWGIGDGPLSSPEPQAFSLRKITDGKVDDSQRTLERLALGPDEGVSLMIELSSEFVDLVTEGLEQSRKGQGKREREPLLGFSFVITLESDLSKFRIFQRDFSKLSHYTTKTGDPTH